MMFIFTIRQGTLLDSLASAAVLSVGEGHASVLSEVSTCLPFLLGFPAGTPGTHSGSQKLSSTLGREKRKVCPNGLIVPNEVGRDGWFCLKKSSHCIVLTCGRKRG